jgi:hypothetical protein
LAARGDLSVKGGTRVRPYIKEVILENFMSHEYSRIPLQRGLNVIVGLTGGKVVDLTWYCRSPRANLYRKRSSFKRSNKEGG